jgi:hypothetical protein
MAEYWAPSVLFYNRMDSLNKDRGRFGCIDPFPNSTNVFGISNGILQFPFGFRRLLQQSINRRRSDCGRVREIGKSSGTKIHLKDFVIL